MKPSLSASPCGNSLCVNQREQARWVGEHTATHNGECRAMVHQALHYISSGVRHHTQQAGKMKPASKQQQQPVFTSLVLISLEIDQRSILTSENYDRHCLSSATISWALMHSDLSRRHQGWQWIKMKLPCLFLCWLEWWQLKNDFLFLLDVLRIWNGHCSYLHHSEPCLQPILQPC